MTQKERKIVSGLQSEQKDSPTDQLACHDWFLLSLDLRLPDVLVSVQGFAQCDSWITLGWLMATGNLFSFHKPESKLAHRYPGSFIFCLQMGLVVDFSSSVSSYLDSNHSFKSFSRGSQVAATWWAPLAPAWQWIITFYSSSSKKRHIVMAGTDLRYSLASYFSPWW